MTGEYDDIINLPHHVSRKHPPMAAIGRAAQFSPFAALTGYDAAVKETARLTDERTEMDEYGTRDCISFLNSRHSFRWDSITNQPLSMDG